DFLPAIFGELSVAGCRYSAEYHLADLFPTVFYYVRAIYSAAVIFLGGGSASCRAANELEVGIAGCWWYRRGAAVFGVVVHSGCNAPAGLKCHRLAVCCSIWRVR